MQLLQEDISTEQIHGMLRLKESEIEHRLSTEQSKLARIKERMQLLEHKGRMDKELEVIVKRVESMHNILWKELPAVKEDRVIYLDGKAAPFNDPVSLDQQLEFIAASLKDIN